MCRNFRNTLYSICSLFALWCGFSPEFPGLPKNYKFSSGKSNVALVVVLDGILPASNIIR